MTGNFDFVDQFFTNCKPQSTVMPIKGTPHPAPPSHSSRVVHVDTCITLFAHAETSGRMTGRVTFDSCIWRYHVFKDFWNPTIGDTLTTKPEFGNSHDSYAVVVVTSDDTIVSRMWAIKWGKWIRFANIYFSRIAAKTAKFAKYESLKKYALYGITPENC